MTTETRYDLVVIGGGPAGVAGATTAAMAGKRVALVERSPFLGGAGINTGTVPSKTLRETALTLNGIRARRLTGLDLSLKREATITDFTTHEREVKRNERVRLVARLARWDIEVIQAEGRFADPHGIDADGRRLVGNVILIATGSAPARPPEFPFEDDRVHDSNEILELHHLPRSLAVIGAGTIGCEYACTFAALNTRVAIIDARGELLPFLDSELSRRLRRAMVELGIEFCWNERVVSCDVAAPGPVRLQLASGRRMEIDGVLVAAGRTSNTGSLNLAAAGLESGPRGLIPVDEHYQTTVPHIYATGDVIGAPALASTSRQQARIAVSHAFRLGAALSPPELLPTGIYTIPEVSSVGQTEDALRREGVPYVVGRASYADSARGDIIGEEAGFMKLLFRQDTLKLLGVHVMGEQATELVHIGLLALLAGADAHLFEAVCFNFPTLSDLYKTAAIRAIRAAKAAGVA